MDNGEVRPIRLFNIYGENRGTGFAGNVWDVDYIAPCITTSQGGGREPMIVVYEERDNSCGIPLQE